LLFTGTVGANPYLYNEQQYDESTGLYYLRARYMNPSTGRFISADTYPGSINDPVSLHKYLYANGNPVMFSDPTGYKSLAETAAVTYIMGIINSMATLHPFIYRTIIGGLIGAAISGIDAALGGGNAKEIAIAILQGFGFGMALSALFYFIMFLGITIGGMPIFTYTALKVFAIINAWLTFEESVLSHDSEFINGAQFFFRILLTPTQAPRYAWANRVAEAKEEMK
jgi:RHS repeat-associated protein